MEKYCSSITDILWDDDKCRDMFIDSAKRVQDVADGNLHRDNIRTEPFTNALLLSLK